MARQPPKRQHADDRSRSDTESPTKKTKTRSETELEAWASWQYPPEFWDRLSKITLTRKAVEEYNRRVRLEQHPSPPLPRPQGRAEHLVYTLPAKRLARFAQFGGPDLSDLRGVRRRRITGLFCLRGALTEPMLASTTGNRPPSFCRHECEPIFTEPDDEVH